MGQLIILSIVVLYSPCNAKQHIRVCKFSLVLLVKGRHRSTQVSTVLWKMVRFFIIDIFLMNKKLGFIQGECKWSISCPNELETQEKGTTGS